MPSFTMYALMDTHIRNTHICFWQKKKPVTFSKVIHIESNYSFSANKK